MVDFGEDLPFKAECSKVILPQIFYTMAITAFFVGFLSSFPLFIASVILFGLLWILNMI